MEQVHSGQCHCGKVVFSVSLPEALEQYRPVACDCDFCVARQARYLSHPDGSLAIQSAEPLCVMKQGSEQADFLTCASCGTLVAVVYPFDEGLKGTVNAARLDESERLTDPIVVSPKRLQPTEKLSRWDKAWLGVRINGRDRL